jgi:AraC-like DNA-binding protein
MDSTFIHFSLTPIPCYTPSFDGLLPAHAVMIIPPNAPIIHGSSKTPWHRSWIRLCGKRVLRFIESCGLPLNTPIPCTASTANREALLAIHREMHHPDGAIPPNAEDLFRIWIRRLAHERSVRAATIPGAFLRARQFIELNYLRPLRLETIAEHAGLSSSHLCKGFRRHFGNSPMDFTIRLRLQHAEELLGNEEMTVTEVARASGFRDVYYFSRTFKQAHGISPSRYRR